MPGTESAASAWQPQFNEVSLDACGCALTASATQILASKSAARRLWGQLASAVAARMPVSVQIDGLGPPCQAVERFEVFCKQLAGAFRRTGLTPSDVDISVPVSALDPMDAWSIRRRVLGDGELNLILGAADVSTGGADEVADDKRRWWQLWALRNVKSVATAFWPQVSSRCPFFSAESAMNVLPQRRLQVPTQTAWLSADVELPNYVNSSGKFDAVALAYELNRLVDSSEQWFDTYVWPTPAMQQDAWLHRRMAICLNGLGDFALRLGLDPEQHRSLSVLNRLLFRIRNTLQSRSRQLAQANESLPGIVGTNLGQHLPAGHDRKAWEQRWSHAIRASAVRHRNLLVLSPWSLLPVLDPDVRFMNLIPLLHHADACRFDRQLTIDTWNVNEFKRFHRRTAAVMRSVEANSLIAEQL